MHPDSEKSTSQKASDTVSGGSKDAENQGSSLLGQAQDTLSNAANSASDALGLNSSSLYVHTAYG